MAIFTLFFSGLFDLSSLGISTPYYLFAFCGYASWIYFVYLVQSSGTALVQDEALIKKSYFPKLLLPLSRALVGLVDYVISLLVLFLIAGATGDLKFQWIGLLPIILLLHTMVGLSLAVWLSGLTIRHRDFIHFIPYLVNFGIWLTPIFYPVTIIPEQYAFLSYLNPMSFVADVTRWAILGTNVPDLNYIWSIMLCFILGFAGLKYFITVENDISDNV